MHEEEEDHSRMDKPVNPETPLTATTVSDPPTKYREQLRRHIAAIDGRRPLDGHTATGFGMCPHPECMAFRPQTMADAAEMLWVVLANVSGGNWKEQSQEWQDAAARWRDHYFAVLSGLRSDSAAGDAVSDHSSSHRDGAFAGEDSNPTPEATSPPPAEARDWQPIETAPKDRPFIAANTMDAFRAFYDTEHDVWVCEDDGYRFNELPHPPTHWTSLPPGRAPGRPEGPTS